MRFRKAAGCLGLDDHRLLDDEIGFVTSSHHPHGAHGECQRLVDGEAPAPDRHSHCARIDRFDEAHAQGPANRAGCADDRPCDGILPCPTGQGRMSVFVRCSCPRRR